MFKVTLIVKFVARTKRDQSSEVLMKQDNSLGSNMLKFYSAEVAELADAQRSERCPALRGGGSTPLFGTESNSIAKLDLAQMRTWRNLVYAYA